MKLEDNDQEQPVYAVDKGVAAHRIASLVVFAAWVGLSLVYLEVRQSCAVAAVFLIPLACIWFPEVMSTHKGTMSMRGGYIGSPTAPVIVKWLGWFALLVVPVFVIILLRWR